MSQSELAVSTLSIDDMLNGRYRLLDVIGEGGMGTVYVAFDVELDRKVAVKVLAANLVNDVELLERFEQEAKLTAKLDHPNIIPVYDVGRHLGRPFMVMKLLAGSTLAEVLRTEGGLTGQRLMLVMRQLAQGIDYLHSKGVIHRDIKASNVFIREDGHATILDFGILRVRGAASGLTRTGTVMGTPHYMAPEQAMGLKTADHRVDHYALAVLLFECLTGTLPYDDESELRVIHLQAYGVVPNIRERAPWISESVGAIVTRALAKRPEDRYQTAAQLVEDLGTAMNLALPAGASLSWEIPRRSPPTILPTKRPQGDRQVPDTFVPRSPSTSEMARAMKSRRLWPLIWVAMALTIGGIAVALFWFEPREAAAPIDRGASAFPIDDEARPPPSNHQLESAIDNPQANLDLPESDEPLAPDASVAATALSTAPVAMQARRGRVQVLTMLRGEPYWAQVSVDGVPKGRTPLVLYLSPGRYVIAVERSGYRLQSKEIRVRSAKSAMVRFDLEP